MSRMILFAIAIAIAGAAVPARADPQPVYLRCTRPCDGVANSVRALGGEVTHQYKNVDAIAAVVDASSVPMLAGIVGVTGVLKGGYIAAPAPVQGSPRASLVAEAVDAESAVPLSSADIAAFAGSQPADYLFNNALINAASVQAGGNFGDGVIVADIDTGTTNNASVVADLAGSVIGGETFVTGDPVVSPTSRFNGNHGTWTAGVIAGHAAFLFARTSTLVRSLLANAPTAITSCTATACVIPVIGVAPGSKIYAMKVFKSNSGSSPDSIITAAMDRALTLRRNFNAGMPSVAVAGDGSEDNPFKYDSLNIQVVNMSLGGGSTNAGQGIQDELARLMLDAGMVVSVSAGNAGFAAMTVGSPGTGRASLTAAAANTPQHERVLRDIQFGVGIGPLYRPDSNIQTAYFSSRGPDADGQTKPDLTANGFATFAQSNCNGRPPPCNSLGSFSLVSGTSFSAPTVSGAAALLRKAMPNATAAQIRAALIQGANPATLGDGSGQIDQGAGMLDVAHALALLQAGQVSVPNDPRRPSANVEANVQRAGFNVINLENGPVAAHLSNLRPGEVAQFFVRTSRETAELDFAVVNVTPEQPAAGQNQLFGDDVFVMASTAITSDNSTPPVDDFVASAASFGIPFPGAGVTRIAVQGDWTNKGRVSADVIIGQQRGNLGPPSASGTIAEGDLVPYTFTVAPGTAHFDLMVNWVRDWSRYPSNDIDAFLVAPNGTVNFGAAGFGSPERVGVDKPAGGTWTVLVSGATVNSHRDEFELRITADGARLKARK